MPTIMPPLGTSLVTTALDPILEQLFISIGPRICAPDQTITSSSNVGCLLIPTCSEDLIAGDIPPRVTP